MQTVIACVITAVVALIIGIPIGIQIRKRTAEKEINSAEEEAKRIINESIKSAESKKREALVEAKEEILQARNEYEREVKERRADLQKQERRLQQKEENLDRKTENIEKKEDTLQRKLAELDEARDEVATVKKTQMEVLERISGFTAEEAKNYLINQLAEEVTHESAMKVREIEAQFKEEADTRAKEILSLAIQRCAADHVAEATVSVVPLPNDEMKGRIIGREGRNIRTLETMTGVDLIIDDTPEAITVSCFDPVRREIARIALEKLIQDGRIHPTRIEEMVEKAKREVDATIKAEGERAVFETNVHGLHPELVKLLGRMRYRTSYGQNVLNHSIEVSHLAGLHGRRDRRRRDPGQAGRPAPRPGQVHRPRGGGLPRARSAWSWPGSTRRTRTSSTPLRPTTTTWSPAPSWPASSRRPTPSPPPAPAPGARTWRTISSVWRSWRRSPPPSPAWRSPSPFRPAARCASWWPRTRSARIRWCCWPGTSPRRSRTSWSIPARSRST